VLLAAQDLYGAAQSKRSSAAGGAGSSSSSSQLIAAAAASSTSSLTDGYLGIVLRKQLHSGDARFQRVGVIGSVALACQLAAEDASSSAAGAAKSGSSSSSSSAVEPSSLRQRALAQAQQHVEAVLAVARDRPPLQALLFDELVRCIAERRLDPSLFSWLAE
jgi:hypothetical protein